MRNDAIHTLTPVCLRSLVFVLLMRSVRNDTSRLLLGQEAGKGRMGEVVGSSLGQRGRDPGQQGKGRRETGSRCSRGRIESSCPGSGQKARWDPTRGCCCCGRCTLRTGRKLTRRCSLHLHQTGKIRTLLLLEWKRRKRADRELGKVLHI